MARHFDFTWATQMEARQRQMGVCACCGLTLNSVFEHAHHVIPNQSGIPEDTRYSWLRGTDNCVILCEQCHWRVHQDGRYRTGAVAPPDYYQFSHEKNTQAHQLWVLRVSALSKQIWPETSKVDILVKACQDSWSESKIPGIENKNNCSGFLRSVAEHLNKNLPIAQADGLIDYMKAHWTNLKTVSAAVESADRGEFVVACLKGEDHTPKCGSGHVAVIVPGSLYRGKYPRCWCGSTGTAQSNGNKSVGEVWNTHDRDSVSYYRAP